MKILIVTIPSRLKYAKHLQVITNAEIILDEEGHLLSNHNRAWRKGFESGQKYILVLQDDIILKDNFLARVNKITNAMTLMKMQFVSLYSNRKDDLLAVEKGKNFYIVKGWLNEQAVIMDRNILGGYFDFYNKNWQSYKDWHDKLLQDYCKAYKIDTYVNVPNIVDHRIDIKSSVGHPSSTRGIPRKSRTFNL